MNKLRWAVGVAALALAWGAQAQPPNPPPALEPVLREELARLERALDGRLGIALFRTDDPTVQSFIAGGIVQVSTEAYLRLEAGLASVAVLDGQHNGQRRPMCYVLFNPNRTGPVERSSFRPIAQATGDARQGAAYLAAHEVGHCLDRLEREGILKRQMRWNAQQAQQVGVQPDAFARAFGDGEAATAAYRARLHDLYGDLAQRQYEERVADAFGVLWVWRTGGSDEVQRIVAEFRGRDTPTNAHATAPILQALPALKNQVTPGMPIDGVWALARQAQREAGVDARLGAGSTVARDPVVGALKKVRRDQPPAPPSGPARAKAWNELPRFGAPSR